MSSSSLPLQNPFFNKRRRLPPSLVGRPPPSHHWLILSGRSLKLRLQRSGQGQGRRSGQSLDRCPDRPFCIVPVPVPIECSRPLSVNIARKLPLHGEISIINFLVQSTAKFNGSLSATYNRTNETFKITYWSGNEFNGNWKSWQWNDNIKFNGRKYKSWLTFYMTAGRPKRVNGWAEQ